MVRGWGEPPAFEEPSVVTGACEPPDGPLEVPAPPIVRVRTPTDPEEPPGPAGTVYVTTSTVGLDELAVNMALDPDAGAGLVLPCDEPLTEDPGTVTVRGWGDMPLAAGPDAVVGSICDEDADISEPGA
jgi:hypothetical protein